MHPNYLGMEFPEYKYERFPAVIWPPGAIPGAKGVVPLGTAKNQAEADALLAAVGAPAVPDTIAGESE